MLMRPYIIISRNNRGKTVRRITLEEDRDKAFGLARANNQNPFWRPVSVEDPTMQDLWDYLNGFDWHYAMSDDHRVWRRGEHAEKELTRIILPYFGEPGQQLYQQWREYIQGGNPEKPERPA